jgi:post-segregation antitoxin (ccd killing protein)
MALTRINVVSTMKRKMGRPREFQETIKVTLTITPEHLERARALNLNLSQLLREAIEAKERAVSEKRSEDCHVNSKEVVRPPGFEPGSTTWQADVLNQARLRSRRLAF